MATKQVYDLHLFRVREAGKGFLISLRASNRYVPRYLQELERALALLAEYAEGQGWPGVAGLTTSHLEEYLAYLQTRPRWFGERDHQLRPLSQSYIETQYRRLKRFFNWTVERGHLQANPLDLIPHPHVDERVIATVSARQALDLLRLVDPRHARTPGERFRAVRNKAVLYMLLDTPSRRAEITTLTLDTVDMDMGAVLVMGKSRRQRWMALGNTALEALWEYLQVRRVIAGPGEKALWVSEYGRAMGPDWLYIMLKRLGERPGLKDCTRTSSATPTRSRPSWLGCRSAS